MTAHITHQSIYPQDAEKRKIRQTSGDIMTNRIYYGDNLPILQQMGSSSIDLIYIDPPFNTGKSQSRTQIQTIRSENGDRVGFGGHRYETSKLTTKAYVDLFDDYLGFLEPRL